jgi:flagellar motor switch protein FliN/FliY
LTGLITAHPEYSSAPPEKPEEELAPTPETEAPAEMAPVETPPTEKVPAKPEVEVEKAVFKPFEGEAQAGEPSQIQLLLDVPLTVSVELGRKRLSIKEILDMVPGSLLELDRLAGEPVDLMVNGKLFARGEVVVIDENFGVRIANIISPRERLERLK